MIISQPNLDALRVDLSLIFDKAYGGTPVFYDKLATTIPSNSKSTIYGWLANQLRMKEWSGPRVAQNLSEHTTTVINRKFEATLELSRDAIEDDTLGIFKGVEVPQLANAARKHPDILLASLLQGTPTTFDGLALFHATHPTFYKSATYKNLHALALSADNFATVWAGMSGIVGEDGNPLGVNGTALIVPPQLKKTGLEILNATMIPGAVGTNVLQGWAELIVIPELANAPTTWYVADLSKPLKPFIHQVRRAPEFLSRDSLVDPKVFDQEIFTYGVSSRGEMAPTCAWLIAKSVGP